MRAFFRRAWANIASPKVDEAELRVRLERIRAALPVPVFWFLGKAQSGKTSLIRALTGSTRAEIGDGFLPCTRQSFLYPFPDEANCLLKFLDTRGLGETSYDPAQDIAYCEGQAHLLIVVLKASDHAQGAILDALKQILARHPRWPVIVAQTCLHELYPRVDSPHPTPYPYGDPRPRGVASDLLRSLAVQRSWFQDGILATAQTQFVPVDFTLPEDGYDPVEYGLPELWSAIEAALPVGIRGMISQFREGRKELRDLRFAAAHPHVIAYALAAGGAASIPVPLVDIPLVMALQAQMTNAVASVYAQELTPARMAEIASTVGVGFAGRMGIRELAKLIPGFGSAVSALFAAATTYALGRTLCVYFSHLQDGDMPSQEEFRRLYKREYQQARTRFASLVRDAVVGRPEASALAVDQVMHPLPDDAPSDDVRPESRVAEDRSLTSQVDDRSLSDEPLAATEPTAAERALVERVAAARVSPERVAGDAARGGGP